MDENEIEHQKLPSGEDVWKTLHCELRISMPARHIVTMRVTGILGMGLVPHFKAPADRLMAAGIQPILFSDWWSMTGYDSESRIHLTDWVLKNRKRIGAIHVLVQSKMVAMGVSVANLALGGFMTVYTDRTKFDFTLKTCVKK